MELPFFVYGTLRPGESNYARLLTGLTAAELPATLTGGALYTAGPYPFLVMTPDLAGPGDLVAGDLVVVRPEAYQGALAALDALEGYAPGGAQNMYERVVTEVATAEGPRHAWVYVAGAAALAQIRAGALRRLAGRWPEDAPQPA